MYRECRSGSFFSDVQAQERPGPFSKLYWTSRVAALEYFMFPNGCYVRPGVGANG